MPPVGALLYAGALCARDPHWAKGAPPDVPFVVFDTHRRVVTGPAAGQLLAMQFPEMLRREIDGRCAAAIAGTSARFFCIHNSRPVTFDALPVRNADGAVVCGVLLTAESGPSATPASA